MCIRDSLILYHPDPGEISATIEGSINTNVDEMRVVKYPESGENMLGLIFFII